MNITIAANHPPRIMTKRLFRSFLGKKETCFQDKLNKGLRVNFKIINKLPLGRHLDASLTRPNFGLNNLFRDSKMRGRKVFYV